MSVTEYLVSLSRRFAGDRRGNVSIILALALLPIMAVVGISIDYVRAVSLRSRLQAAADATALMLAKDAPNLSSTEIQSRAQKYFLANLRPEDTGAVNIITRYTPNTGNGATIQVDASADVANKFGAFIGRATSGVGSSSTATWGTARLRIALSLDVTGSMSSAGKIDALRDAVTKFIEDMSKEAKNPGDVLISIVPFAKDVNVGTANRNASWVSFDDWSENNGICSGPTGRGEIPASSYKTRTSCRNAKYSFTWYAYSTSAWQGCVTDREQPYDVLSTAPSTAPYLAEYYPECAPQMMALTSDWTALKQKVASLVPSGNTNQPIGIAMAWQTLLTTSPWPAPAKDTDATYLDVIIHLSDGANTQNRWSTSVSSIDARQATLCENVKQAKVTLYMIQVNTDGSPTQSVMRNCASSEDKFYLLTSGSQTVSTFSEIGKKISALRLSK